MVQVSCHQQLRGISQQKHLPSHCKLQCDGPIDRYEIQKQLHRCSLVSLSLSLEQVWPHLAESSQMSDILGEMGFSRKYLIEKLPL